MSARRMETLAPASERSGDEARNKQDEATEQSARKHYGRGTAPLVSRRSRALFGLAALLALVGLADALYLTMQHLAGAYVRCAVLSGCSEVLGSQYATIYGIPIAGLGAASYFTVFSLMTLAAFGYTGARRFAVPVVALMFGFTLWLLFAQAFILRAFCEFCLLSAAVTFSLAGLLLIERFSRTRIKEREPELS